MKKLFITIFIMLISTFVHATVPIAYTAKLNAPKSMVASLGSENSITSIHAGFTYGLENSNLHAKIDAEGGFLYVEGLWQLNMGKLKDIDLGLTVGGRIRTQPGNPEIAPILIGNASYQFLPNVIFYGGAKTNLDFGNTTWAGFYIDFDLNGFLGTQIDLTERIKLYLEIQPALISGTNNSYVGVSYYFPTNSSEI